MDDYYAGDLRYGDLSEL
ncbi:hypothetical protein ACP26C_20885 [Franconibacter helveticus 513]